MWNAFAVFIGGGLGSLARWAVSGLIATRLTGTFPWGTFLVNITGCFAIGLFATLTAPQGRWAGPVTVQQFLLVGICGGYTTFSAFSLQSLQLLQSGEWMKALAYTVASVLLCLAGVWLGHLFAVNFNSLKG